MALIFGRELFAVEDVAEVAAATGAEDFGAIAVGVAGDGAGQLVIEGGPAAMRRELVGGEIEGCVALAADIDAGLFVVFEATGTGTFGAFMVDHIIFFGR